MPEITLPGKLLRTEAGRAAVAAAWTEGFTQKQIARVFGYAKSPPVNTAILEFIRQYCPETLRPRYDWSDSPKNQFPPQGGERRKKIAYEALVRYARNNPSQ